MNAKYIIYVALSFVLSIYNAHAATTTATSNGDWTEAAIWDNGVPGCFDSIVIPFGIQVDITSTIDLNACADSIVLIVEGRLEFQNGKKLKLPCGSDVIIKPGGSVGVGSGGGSSTYIEICNTNYWSADQGDLTGPDQLCDGGCPPLSPLPIELVYFDAQLNKQKRNVDLYWTTATETNNDYFTVERSSDGTNWEFVCEQKGAINSGHYIDYQDVDNSPLPGVSYYRLKQTDMDGQFSYSPTVSVNNRSNTSAVYPNPVGAGGSVLINLTDNLKKNVSVAVYNMNGQLVWNDNFEVNHSNQIVLTLDYSISPGVYAVRVEKETIRLIVE